MSNPNPRCSSNLFKRLLSLQVLIIFFILLYMTNERRGSFLDSSDGTGKRTSPLPVRFLLFANLSVSSGQSDERTISSVIENSNTTNRSTSSQRMCLPSDLDTGQPPVGKLSFDLNSEMNEWTLDSVRSKNSHVNDGGSWGPSECRSKSRLLVIIPYRDRQQHLVVLLGHLHPLLRQQLIQYTVYVVEQYGNYTFNKGRIMNAAYKEATSKHKFDCVLFHDVDLIPEDSRIPYSCPDQPRHLSVAIDKSKYKLPYHYLVGGVFILRTEHFEKVNGYPNDYWGWGGEDDDIASRLTLNSLAITRPSADIARYKMMNHTKRAWNPNSVKLLKQTKQKMLVDGLRGEGYHVTLSVEKKPLFTYMLVDAGKTNLPPIAATSVPKR